MICKSIAVNSFRNINDEKVEFSDRINILLGENAQGKTNLLEAIYFSALGKSFRPANEEELISYDKDNSQITNEFTNFGTDKINTINMRIFSGKRQKRVELNNMRVDRMSELVGKFKVVLFSPEHLSIIKSGPSLRRNYLDVALSQIKPMYLRSLQRYNTALKQRNALIKNAYKDKEAFNSTVELWSRQLAHEAAYISEYRREYVIAAEKIIARIFSDMTGGRETPHLVYKSSIKDLDTVCSDRDAAEEAYFQKLSTNYDTEIGYGSTLYGIHKDDIEIFLNGREAKIYSSQGQQRSLALALKLAEGEISRMNSSSDGESVTLTKDYPVFLLDDVLSELDRERQSYLMNELRDRQVIMTACQLDKSIIGEDAKVFSVRCGKYSVI